MDANAYRVCRGRTRQAHVAVEHGVVENAPLNHDGVGARHGAARGAGANGEGLDGEDQREHCAGDESKWTPTRRSVVVARRFTESAERLGGGATSFGTCLYVQYPTVLNDTRSMRKDTGA